MLLNGVKFYWQLEPVILGVFRPQKFDTRRRYLFFYLFTLQRADLRYSLRDDPKTDSPYFSVFWSLQKAVVLVDFIERVCGKREGNLGSLALSITRSLIREALGNPQGRTMTLWLSS